MQKQVYQFKTISEYHRILGLPEPDHPLISVIDISDIPRGDVVPPVTMVYDFYNISLKRSPDVRYRYGQQECDFDKGLLFFMAPGQVFGLDATHDLSTISGWMLLIHPDLLWHTTLATHIKQYDFFDYEINEALFLAPREEEKVVSILRNIRQEYQSNIDTYSQDIIIAELELLLACSERYYNRQFITRKKVNHEVLGRLEVLLNDYFDHKQLATNGLPTVQYISDRLGISPGYLRNLLKTLTGLNTQQHIHEKLIDKAKQQLSTTDLSVSEIAYMLGFEHPQSFSKLFKSKTNLSPLEFRASFN
ncbi:MAG: helix-turn-helix transcriptional regulator [Bacteroidetes bacterium]|nr:helix-turn-helix transcriptional regulator [Bacteroidota bacterium]